jgi:TetR/AcrR family transcriptional regulator, cholesterol catabolism regulator
VANPRVQRTGSKATPKSRDRRSATSGIARRRSAAKVDSSPEYLARRQRLLESAAKIFHKKGYSRTKLAEVAEAAGIDRANLYYYVENKQDLYLEVLERYMAFEAEARLDVVTAPDSATSRLRMLMVDLMRRYEEHYPYAYLPTRETISFFSDEEETAAIADQVNALGRLQFRAIRQVLKEGIERGEFEWSLSAGVLAEAVVGMLAWSCHWFDPKTSRFSGAEIGDAFASLVLNGLAKERGTPEVSGIPQARGTRSKRS